MLAIQKNIVFNGNHDTSHLHFCHLHLFMRVSRVLVYDGSLALLGKVMTSQISHVLFPTYWLTSIFINVFTSARSIQKG